MDKLVGVKRVGVVADTHCPEFLDSLPDRVFEVLQGVDLILHAGDIDAGSTLDALGKIAPVEAVRGDHDRLLPNLPAVRELTVEGKRIVVVHGERSHWVEEPQTLLWTLSLGHFHPHAGLGRVLRRRFPGADAIVYGHTHRPRSETIDGTLVFNPGAVHQWNPTTARRRLARHPGWFEWCWLQVAKYLQVYQAPTIGTLDVSESGIVATVVSL